jgi:NADPH:quinone reductase-like Zn-dependent oxidoreductase
VKAIVLERYGVPARLRLEDIPKPTPETGEVLVKIRATAVNDYDWCLVRGRPYLYRFLFGWFRPKFSIAGAEIAGVVEATGHGAGRFHCGDHVYGDTSEAGFGAFAEYVCVPEHALSRMPNGMTFEQAAAIPHAGALAQQGLVDLGRIGEGERVLINGAGGGVGVMALHIAKQHRAHVTGVDEAFKLDALEALGFDRVIDFRRVDFTRAGTRYDLILDTKTTRSPHEYLRCLNPSGRYVTVGGRLPRLLQIVCFGPLLGRLTGKHLRLLALKPNEGLAQLGTLFEAGGLRCLIDGPHPLRSVPDAIQRFGEGRHTGKLVISVDD